jgi:tetratricopeptide (TPR) repeat protein
MAPEQIEALADGTPDRVDHRSDLYSLGVVLCEALGTRPFSGPSRGTSVSDNLKNLIQERRAGPPSLRADHPEVPAALEAIVRKCLEPEPANRYARASELAADLQAVVRDGPLLYTREPEPSRTLRWLRRNRKRLALATPVVLGLVALVIGLVQLHESRLKAEYRALDHYQKGERLRDAGEFLAAEQQFRQAAQLAGHWTDLRDLNQRAASEADHAKVSNWVLEKVDGFFARTAALRFLLLQSDTNRMAASQELRAILEPLGLFEPGAWTRRPLWRYLDDSTRKRLFDEVNELLSLWVYAADHPTDRERAKAAIEYCDLALRNFEPREPWLAFRARYQRVLHIEATGPAVPAEPMQETSARACFQWGLLAKLKNDPELARLWLERAVRLEASSFWYEFTSAYFLDHAGKSDQALARYDTAIALQPDSAWALFNRARIYAREKGAYGRALADLNRVLEKPGGIKPAETVRLELGMLQHRLGDYGAARSAFEAVIAARSDAELTRRARLSLAKLDADCGRISESFAAYNALLTERPDDSVSRTGRARLAMILNEADTAEADFTRVLQTAETPTARAQALAGRAQAWLALGRPDEAVEDASAALRLALSPGHERLWIRTMLAAGRAAELPTLHPDDLDLLPPDAALRRDLAGAADRMAVAAGVPDGPGFAAMLKQAAILSTLGRHVAAEAAATRAIELAPLSTQALLLRAEVHHRAGDRAAALADLDRGLGLEPDSPSLLALRAALRLDAGQPAAALGDLEVAFRLGGSDAAHATRARVLVALNRPEEALEAWNLALRADPEDSAAYLGRARTFLRLRAIDQVLGDLESAAAWSYARPSLLAPIALTYAACLPARPNRLGRVAALGEEAVKVTLWNQLVKLPCFRDLRDQ